MNTNRVSRSDSQRPQPNRDRAPLRVTDDGLSRAEGVLFLLLIGAVGLAFASHAQVAHGFIKRLPEFAGIVADLFRHAV